MTLPPLTISAATFNVGNAAGYNGSVVLSGATVSPVAVNLNAGTLMLGSGAVLTTPSLNVTGGAIAAADATGRLNGSLNYTSSTSSSFGGRITGAGSTLALNNAAATLTLTGTTNTYGGATTVNGGVLAAGVANALSPNSSVSVGTNGTPGTLDVTVGAQTVKALTVGPLGMLNLSVGNLLTSSNAANFNGTLNLSNLGGIAHGSSTELTELISYPSYTGAFSSATTLPFGESLVYGRHVAGYRQHSDLASRIVACRLEPCEQLERRHCSEQRRCPRGCQQHHGLSGVACHQRADYVGDPRYHRQQQHHD